GAHANFTRCGPKQPAHLACAPFIFGHDQQFWAFIRPPVLAEGAVICTVCARLVFKGIVITGLMLQRITSAIGLKPECAQRSANFEQSVDIGIKMKHLVAPAETDAHGLAPVPVREPLLRVALLATL